MYISSYGFFSMQCAHLTNFFNKMELAHVLNKELENGDILIVYHSIWFMGMLEKVLRKKKVKLIFQVNEFYSDVYQNPKLKKPEIEYLKQAEAYIFTSRKQAEYLQAVKKPSTIIQGTCFVDAAKQEEVLAERKRHETNVMKHIVYAGVFEKRKGVGNAIMMARYLDQSYCIHIIGFGTKDQIEEMKKDIAESNSVSSCQIVYDGCLKGKEYEDYLLKCDIGLCTQNKNASFNETSFPSKIMSYMTNGLRVVCVRIPAIENSFVKDSVFFYDEDSPQAIAECVKKIDFDDDYDSLDVLRKEDSRIAADLKSIINRLLTK